MFFLELSGFCTFCAENHPGTTQKKWQQCFSCLDMYFGGNNHGCQDYSNKIAFYTQADRLKPRCAMIVASLQPNCIMWSHSGSPGCGRHNPELRSSIQLYSWDSLGGATCGPVRPLTELRLVRLLAALRHYLAQKYANN